MDKKNIYSKILISMYLLALIFLMLDILFRISYINKYSIYRFNEEANNEKNIINYIKPYEVVTHGNVRSIMNPDGFRETDFLPAKNKKKIAIIGDSFTFGYGVNDSDSFPYKLKKKLIDMQIMNFGFIGLNALDNYWIYKNNVQKIKPDLVIYAFYPNDLEFSVQNIDYNYCLALEEPTLVRYLIYGKSNLISKTKSMRTEEIKELKINYFEDGNPSLECFSAIIGKLSYELRKNQTDFLIIYIPSQPFKKLSDEDKTIVPRIKKIADTYHVDFVDLTKEIWKHSEDKKPEEVFTDFYNGDYHYNKYINEIIAKNLSQYVLFRFTSD